LVNIRQRGKLGKSSLFAEEVISIMFRTVLIAYLSLATAISSPFCCCNMRQLFAKSATASCCQAGVLRDMGCPNCQAEDSERDATAKALSPCSGNHRCACAIRQAKLLAPTTVVSDAGASWGVVNLDYQAHLNRTLVLPSLDSVTISIREKRRPATLYGRDILRAYQILTC
jgi:hypothetical protein